MSQDQITAYIKASDFVGEGAIGTYIISLSRIDNRNEYPFQLSNLIF